MKKLFLFFIAAFAVSLVYAQQPEKRSQAPTSREPGAESRSTTLKKKSNKGFLFFNSRKAAGISYDEKVEEFYKRMEAAAKRRKKMEKEMKKPQYSDPLYFGHKRPPKKRPPGKKKFCNVCGIVH